MSSSSKKKNLKDQTVSRETLPQKPSLQVLKKSDEEMENFDATRTDYQINIDAIAGLAFIENVKSGSTKDQFNKKGWNDKEEQTSVRKKPDLKIVESPTYNQESKFNFKTLLYIAVIAGSVYGTYLLLHSKNSPTKVAKVKEKKVEYKEVTPKRVYMPKKKKVSSFRKRERKPRRITRAPAAASFKDSQVFKKHKVRKLEENPVVDDYEKDDYYKDDYDNGDEPIENDPVRAKTSKEMINPEDDYFDEDERDLYDEMGERTPSSKKEEKTWVNSENQESEYDEYDDEVVDGEEEQPFEDSEEY